MDETKKKEQLKVDFQEAESSPSIVAANPEHLQSTGGLSTQSNLNVTQGGSRVKAKREQDLVGELIDNKYQVLSFVGSGGMSSVYKVKHMLLNKTLALKMIHPHLTSDKESLARFQREAEATSRLDHPNVVKVYEFGITKDDNPYIVMDFIEGITLAQAISEDSKLNPERAIKLITQAAAGLSHAHSRNVVHRDIKPSNIMLVKQDGVEDFVKVVDFGIAQMVAEDTELAKLTQTGQIFGTPMYMSPEQCQGLNLDARTDIYSLGCVLYEALVGKTPFTGNSVYELIFKQMNEAPAGLGKSVSDKPLRDSLETIIFRSIAKDANDRYQTMQEMKDDLEHIYDAPAKGPLAYLKSFIRQWYFRQLSRNLKPMMSRLPLVAATIAITIGGIAYLVYQQKPQAIIASEATWKELDRKGQQQFDHGDKAAALSTFQQALDMATKLGNKDFIIASKAELEDINFALGHTKEAEAIVAELKKSTTGEEASDKELLTDINNEIAREKKRITTDSKELQQLEQRMNDSMDSATTLMIAGDFKKATELIEAIREVCKISLPNSRISVRALHNKGEIASAQGHFEEAIAHYKNALDKAKTAITPNDELKGKTLVGLANVYMTDGRHLDEARELLMEAGRIKRACFGPFSYELGSVKYQLARLDAMEGKKSDAKKQLNSAIQILSKAPGEPDKVKGMLAMSYFALAKSTDDENLALKALGTFEEETIKPYAELVKALKYLAAHYSSSNPALAQAYLDRAKAMTKGFSQANIELMEPETLQIQSAIDIKNGKLGDAEANLRSALEKIDEHNKGKTTLGKLITLNRLAQVLSAKKDTQTAENTYKEIFSAIKEDPNLKEGLGNSPFLGYVRLLNGQNRQAEAETLAKEWKTLNQQTNSQQ